MLRHNLLAQVTIKCDIIIYYYGDSCEVADVIIMLPSQFSGAKLYHALFLFKKGSMPHVQSRLYSLTTLRFDQMLARHNIIV